MHKEEMDAIDIEGIAREFARKNESRQLFSEDDKANFLKHLTYNHE